MTDKKKPQRKASPTGAWPRHVPGGPTPLDRAREIARAAVQKLAKHSPADAEMIVKTAEAFGETWLRTYLDHDADPDELLTTAEAAVLVEVKPVTIRKWYERGHISRIRGKYIRRELLEHRKGLDLVTMNRESSQ